jgi:hypothetical protein
MSVADVHLEGLLDREPSSISEAERSQLAEHLASCVECRFERQVRRDFALALRGPTGVDDVSEMIDRVLREPPEVPPTKKQPRLAMRRPWRWLSLAAMVLGSAAVAAYSLPLLERVFRGLPPAPP